MTHLLFDTVADDECREWLKEIAPTREYGIVTGLPREETIRPPDSPGYRDWVILPNGDTLHTGDIFVARARWGDRRYVFRRARNIDDEITAWGPIDSQDDCWNTFTPAQVVTLAEAA